MASSLNLSVAVLCTWFVMQYRMVQCVTDNNNVRAQDVLMDILESGTYDAKIPPNFNKDIPADVSVQLVVLSVDSVDESSMDYSMIIYLRQQWVDERLEFSHMSRDRKSHNQTAAGKSADNLTDGEKKDKHQRGNKGLSLDRLELDTRVMHKVWSPDTYFVNERKAQVHKVTVPNKLMHIFSDGRVFYSMRVSLTLTCPMALSKYPFDRQTCPLTVASYGFSEKILRYGWYEEKAIIVKDDVELPTFTIDGWTFHDCDSNFATDGYSCLQLSVTLTRQYGHYITQVYIPSVLIVTLSWVNFWLDIEAVPARTSLGLLTVLTMTTMSAGARGNLPKVSYVKAIDLWMAVCLFFVFGALLEFSYVNVTSRVQKRRLSMRAAVKLAAARAAEEGKTKTKKPAFLAKTSNTTTNNTSSADRARRVDKISRIAFPSMFLCFNLFYWCFYMI